MAVILTFGLGFVALLVLGYLVAVVALVLRDLRSSRRVIAGSDADLVRDVARRAHGD